MSEDVVADGRAALRWKEILQRGGAYALGARTRIRVTGADCLRYLNGQLSNDAQKLKSGAALQALLLTAKGKLNAVVHVWLEDDAVIVDADPGRSEDLEARLSRYIVADDVELLDESTEAAGWHVFGAVSEGLPGLKINRVGEPGVDTTTKPPSGVILLSPEEYELLRITRGVPAWGSDLDENTLPHEARLEESAVDFHKGCYVGQETVSRLQSVGRANRRLCTILGDFPLRPGLKLTTEGGDNAGTITSAALHFELAKTVALAYVQTRLADSSYLVTDESGATLGHAQRHEFPLHD